MLETTVSSSLPEPHDDAHRFFFPNGDGDRTDFSRGRYEFRSMCTGDGVLPLEPVELEQPERTAIPIKDHPM